MSSELLYALTPVIPRRPAPDAQQRQQPSQAPQDQQQHSQNAARSHPELRLQPVLVRPRGEGVHRSELEFAMTELPSPQYASFWIPLRRSPPSHLVSP
jgi:hypothetical protein